MEDLKHNLWPVFNKQPPELFCKKRCSQKCRKIHRKTPLPESLFNKVGGLRPATLLKRDSGTGVLQLVFAAFLRTPFLIEHLWWLLLTCDDSKAIIIYDKRNKPIVVLLSGCCSSCKSIQSCHKFVLRSVFRFDIFRK